MIQVRQMTILKNQRKEPRNPKNPENPKNPRNPKNPKNLKNRHVSTLTRKILVAILAAIPLIHPEGNMTLMTALDEL